MKVSGALEFKSFNASNRFNRGARLGWKEGVREKDLQAMNIISVFFMLDTHGD